MSLIEVIAQDTITALKAGRSSDVGTLRLLSGALKNREIEKRGKGDAAPLSDGEALEVLGREAKKRKEAIELYTKGNRAELAAKEGAELELIYNYLPRELSRVEVEAEISKLLETESSREFSVVMRAAMERLKGRADGKLVSEIIKGKLG